MQPYVKTLDEKSQTRVLTDNIAPALLLTGAAKEKGQPDRILLQNFTITQPINPAMTPSAMPPRTSVG